MTLSRSLTSTQTDPPESLHGRRYCGRREWIRPTAPFFGPAVQIPATSAMLQGSRPPGHAAYPECERGDPAPPGARSSLGKWTRLNGDRSPGDCSNAPDNCSRIGSCKEEKHRQSSDACRLGVNLGKVADVHGSEADHLVGDNQRRQRDQPPGRCERGQPQRHPIAGCCRQPGRSLEGQWKASATAKGQGATATVSSGAMIAWDDFAAIGTQDVFGCLPRACAPVICIVLEPN